MKKLLKRFVNRETILYIIFGVLTTLVNWVLFDILNNALGERYAVFSEVTSIIASIIFAFLTNKPFVFQSHDWSARTLAKEIPAFFGGRALTLLIQTGLIVVARDVFHAGQYTFLGINGLTVAHAPISVIVIVLNYVFSKLFVFKKKEQAPKEPQERDPEEEA